MRHITTWTCFVALLAATCLLGCGGGSTVAPPDGPLLTGLEPATGGVPGGTTIVIKGERLANSGVGANDVLIGGQPAENIVVEDSNTISCRTPAGTAGPADVTVVKENGEDTLPGAFTYFPSPTVTSIVPAEGTRFGGTPITILGSGFLNNNPGMTIPLIGLKACENVVIVDDSTITAESPSSYVETTKSVSVVNDNGEGVLPNGWNFVGPTPLPYSIVPTEGYASGGDPVEITGDYFTLSGGQLKVYFGTTQASAVTRIDDQHITCLTPAGPRGEFVDVVVENVNGPGTLVDGFWYIPSCTVTGIDPDKGLTGGGEEITITGEGFAAGTPSLTTVTFGSNPATNVVIVSDTEITCTAPAGAVGIVDVTVENENGPSTLPGAYEYTVPVWWETTFGTLASLSDDSTTAVSITGFSFPFFGTGRTSFNINSNGWVSFGGGSGSYYYGDANSRLQTLWPQIAGYQRDLNPSGLSGSSGIFYVEQSDRMIVTFRNVPQYGGAGSVSFQIHMLDTGQVGIVYNGITGTTGDGMCAVSPGSGRVLAPVDFTSGTHVGSSTDALHDLTYPGGNSPPAFDNGWVFFVPNTGGGYTSDWHSGVPTDPN